MTTENMTTTGNDVTPKLLDVSAIPLIKHDILHNVKDSIDAIRDSITDEYKKELYDEIEKIKDDFENTSLEDKLELLDKIKALQDKQSTASEAINALKQSVIRLEEGTDDDGNQSSVLDPEEITLLMKAALIEESFWTEDMIGAPSVLGKQIIGLVGLFGKIKASNIEGDLISGKTLQSYDKTKLVSGTQYENFDAESNTLGIETADGTTKGPAWQLRQDGDGYLAAGRISWDADGDVTLTGVKMSFNELVDVPDFTDGISIYTSTIFLRSNEEPAVPEGGSFSDPLPRISINNGIIWEDGIPEGDGVLWTSTRIFASDFTSDKNQSTWSEPRKLADDVDFEVIYGVEGANLGDLPTPEHVKENEGMKDYNGWYDEDKDAALQIIYMATSKKSEGKWSPWSISKIKGEDGQSINIVGIYQTLDQFKEEIAGPDLNNAPENVSYCYIVANDLYVWNITLQLWENIGRFNGKDGKDGIDAVSTFKSTVFKRSEIDLTSADRPEGGSWKDPIPEGWEDGIPEGTGAIWMSHRTFYDKGNDEYNELSFWSIPKKMIDTQSFEVIYGVEGADLDHAQLPTPEYVKQYEGLVNYNGWYDEDTNVPEDKEIWYMATAKNDNGKWSKWNISKIKGEKGGDGKSVSIFGSFDTLEEFQTRIAGINLDIRPDDISAAYVVAGDLYVWVENIGRWMNVGKFAGKDGKDAVSKYKSIVYKRSSKDLTAEDKPVGGIWEDAVPEGWSDGIPSGEGAIWMSYKIIYSDNSMNESTEWSIPEKMIDSQTFEVIYGTENANRNKLPKLPITEGLADIENGWYDDEYSVPAGEEIWYMATAKCDNNKWGDWSVAKIKGESGKDGKSIQIKEYFATLDEFKEIAGDDLSKEPTDVSYCYVVAGDLYVWDDGEKQWENKGQFTGSDGASAYLHIKYAKNIEFDDLGGITLIDLTDEDGESSKDAIWMGIGYNDTLEDPMPSTGSDDIYKWTKIVVDPIITPVKFKSMAFTRISISVSDDIIKTIIPTGGTYEKPVPAPYNDGKIGITWYDGIPETSSEDTKIWMTTATFESDKDYTDPNTKVEWSAPTKMSDLPGKFETAYGDSSVELNGSIDTSGLPKDDKGRANPDGEFNNGWVDEPINGGDYPYMATATFEKDSWSNWKVVKIKGEKGEKGAGIKYKDNVNTIEDLVFPPENNEYDAAYIVKTNPEDDTDTQWNHLFAWTGIDYTPNEKHDKYKTDSGSWIYNGWSDTGQFNGRDGENGKTSYIYIKYAEHIEFDADGNIDPTKCILGSNSGEKKDRWMGIGNGFDVLEPTLDIDDEENYSPDNWKKYNWIDLSNEDLTNELITLTLGTYNISAEHVAGKTIDTCVTGKDGDHTGKVELIEGTKFQEFEFVKNNEGKEEEQPKKDLTIAGENTEGPAWQLRKDGAGYLAAGNIRWDSAGNVEFGPEVTIGWNEEWDEKIPDIPEGGLTEDKVNEIIITKITKDYVESLEVRATDIKGDTITGKTIKSSDDSWMIDKDGSGHLANGNIEWGVEGNLNIAGKITVGGNTVSDDGENIPGEVNIGSGVSVGPWKTFESGEVSYIGDADSTGDSTNYFGSDGTFKIGGVNGIFKETPDGNVQISSKVEFIGGGGSGDEDNSGLTKEELNDWWDKTTIDGGKITAGTITAKELNINNIAAKVIEAQKAEIVELVADDITVKRLNTTGSEVGAGTISIEDNDISVNNKKYNYEILRITGDELSEIKTDSIDKQINSSEYNPTSPKGDAYNNISLYGISGNGLSYDYSEASIDLTNEENPFNLSVAKSGNYTEITCKTRYGWSDNYIYPNNGDGFNVKIASNLFITNVTPEEFKILAEDGSDYAIIHPNLSELKTYNMFNEYIVNERDDPWQGTDSINSSICFNKIYLHLYDNVTGKYTSTEINQNDIITLPGKTKYYLISVSRIFIDNIDDYIHELNSKKVGEDVFISISLATPTLKLKKTITKCEISSFGFRYIVDENKYVEFAKNGNFKIKNNHATLYLNNNSIYMGFSDKDGNEIIPRKIVPKTAKFKLTNEVDKTLTVLTFGEEWDGDEF